ncbi:unnamed protein product [Wuchereria bancrofti]|uniref:Uncharacterized protein n=2 Tax=Wuchereria bancrofti TaxID=6293 RepID=A0A3P7DZA4_WUCBA|nr:unnamed protein product [Wuchereria bancrofti]
MNAYNRIIGDIQITVVDITIDMVPMDSIMDIHLTVVDGHRRWVADLVHRLVHLDLHFTDRNDSYFTVHNLIILSDYLRSTLSFIFPINKIEFFKRLHNEKLHGNFSIIDIIWLIRIIFIKDLISHPNDNISNINTITSWR